MSAREGVDMSEDVYRLIYRSRDLIPDGSFPLLMEVADLSTVRCRVAVSVRPPG